MILEQTPIRIKFINQPDKAPYEREILEIDELDNSEKEELLQIFLRLKKRNFYNRVTIEELLPFCTSIEIKEKAEKFISINSNK